MRSILRPVCLGLVLTVTAGAILPAMPALADPPGHARQHGKQHGKDSGKGRYDERGRHGDGGGGNLSISISFNDSDRIVARDYFGGIVKRGHCPPGLAKKHNGCMPPGQARKWAIGHPLPRDVIFHDLPHDLMIRMSVPPQGYRYVRVAADILMIAVGTGMVVAAIEDLMG